MFSNNFLYSYYGFLYHLCGKKLLPFLSFIFLVNINSFSQTTDKPISLIDYHVHIFSEALVSNLEDRGISFKNSGFKVLKKSYDSPEELFKNNPADKLLLISTGYAYVLPEKNVNRDSLEYDFVKKENNLLAKIKQTSPEKYIGFYGINPLKEYATAEILRCHNSLGLDGIKLHLQFSEVNWENPEHLEKMKKIFSILSKNQIPALIHNNASNFFFARKHFQIFEKEILNKNDSLTIIFAHAGGAAGFTQFTYDFLNEYLEFVDRNKFNKKNHHRIYFELSSVIKRYRLPGSVSYKELKKLIQEIGEDSFLFGSDFPVRESEAYKNELKYYLQLDAKLLDRICKNDIFKK